MGTIYKNRKAKETMEAYYCEKLNSLGVAYEEKQVFTRFGKTHVILSGNPQGKKIVVFHGIHAGSPVALEAVKPLTDEFYFILIDTVGQATKSAETTMSLDNDDFAVWAKEVTDQLEIPRAVFLGISYGGFILQKMMTYFPERVSKAIMVVPAGIVNGSGWKSVTNLFLPLLAFQITKRDRELQRFLSVFVPEEDGFMFKMQRNFLLGVKMDYRRPPLLNRQDVASFERPVYIISADDDIFFPEDKLAKRSAEIFQNLREVHLLKGAKHIPAKKHQPKIQELIRRWAREE